MNNARIVVGLSAVAFVCGCTTASPPARNEGPAPELGVSSPQQEVVLQADAVDELPVVIYQTPPVYPFALVKRGVSGRVVVSLVVRPDGTVDNVRIVSSTHAEFETSAISCVKEWRFEPAMKDGAPVACQVTMPITYNLHGR